jgi:hypothetical protein
MGVAGSIFKSHPCNFEFYVFFIDDQMILVSFFDIPNQKSVNQEKPIFFPVYPTSCLIWTNLDSWWGKQEKQNRFFLIYGFLV